jgi:hypothetical protein
MAEDEKSPKIPKLTGPANYRIWAEEVRSFLEGRGLLDITLGLEPRPQSTSGPSSSSSQATTVFSADGVTPQEAWREECKGKNLYYGLLQLCYEKQDY